ncbi:cytochrome c biogenesis CcdA family protein [Alkalilacustris brevis]|uniref:cytochrome c biogenesis CcdA family protein n=1 Tax=Alkalilacustris brevis TaxID=2026338 RepID=UPI000E0D5546|nr:cytochrome c biogenesis protein CcdA [Alkalilacustris brevis]
MLGIDIFDAALLPALMIAVMAGGLSFLSPCVLPIVPPYLAYMGGISMNDLTAEGRTRHRAVLPALFFVLGLSTVFLFLGFTASTMGSLFLRNQDVLATGAGVVIYVFGLHFVGLNRGLQVFAVVLAALAAILAVDALIDPDAAMLAGLWGGLWAYRIELGLLAAASGLAWALPYNRFPLLDREARFDAGDRGGSAFGAYLLGLAFAFGWTPCIGPILGAILSMAATEADVTRGTALLGAYAVGLGVPFLLAAIFVERSMTVMTRIKRHMALIERLMGALLLLVGVALVTGAFTAFSWWLLEMFPALGLIG